MKTAKKMIWTIFAVLLLAGCGSSSDTASTSATSDGRLITGTIDTSATTSLAKSATPSADCIGDVCAVRAYGSDGTEIQGEIVQAENRWRLRVRNGNWMFAFLDGNGQRLGLLALNGITAFTVGDGDDLEVGAAQFRNGYMINENDVEGLGLRGMSSYHGRDADRDGIPAEFDDDDPPIDADVFAVWFIRPFDAQPHVAPCRPVKIAFTQPLNDATVTSDTVKVLNAADASAIAGTLKVEEDLAENEYEVKFLPDGGYPMGATIEVTIVSGTSGVLSETGKPLAADVATSFTVRDFGGTSMTCHDPDEEMAQLREQQREQEQSGNPGI